MGKSFPDPEDIRFGTTDGNNDTGTQMFYNHRYKLTDYKHLIIRDNVENRKIIGNFSTCLDVTMGHTA